MAKKRSPKLKSTRPVGEPVSSQPAAKPRDPKQDWFWTDAWQAGEREADADIAAGRITRYENVEELIADLDRSDQPKARNAGS